MIDAMLKELQDAAKEGIRGRTIELKVHPKRWKQRAACYVFEHGSISVHVDTFGDYVSDVEPLWCAMVHRYAVPYRTKEEATACAVGLLLEGLASRINYRKPRIW